MEILKKICRIVLGGNVYARLQQANGMRLCRRKVYAYYRYDAERLLRCMGTCNRESLLAHIIATYHVVEKGLTMPNRRFVFGREVVLRLMELIYSFESKYDERCNQVVHAISVVFEYYRIHERLIHDNGANHDQKVFFARVEAFVRKHSDVRPAHQIHMTRELFYANRCAPFDSFSFARHTLRHYCDKPLPIERIQDAVKIALSTPTACNRQYCRVHCITDKARMFELLDIQNGNRGFGHLADKLLLVTSDLEGIFGAAERNDVYTNGGMFIMNLCYALYYEEVAHCVLNWSKSPEEDAQLREIVTIKPSEVVVAMIVCGETPKEFDIAMSPRKDLSEILVVH